MFQARSPSSDSSFPLRFFFFLILDISVDGGHYYLLRLRSPPQWSWIVQLPEVLRPQTLRHFPLTRPIPKSRVVRVGSPTSSDLTGHRFIISLVNQEGRRLRKLPHVVTTMIPSTSSSLTV